MLGTLQLSAVQILDSEIPKSARDLRPCGLDSRGHAHWHGCDVGPHRRTHAIAYFKSHAVYSTTSNELAVAVPTRPDSPLYVHGTASRHTDMQQYIDMSGW